MTTCSNGGLRRTRPGGQNCRSGAAPTAMRISRDYRHIGGYGAQAHAGLVTIRDEICRPGGRVRFRS